MTIRIQRGRQFLAGETSAALFDDKGKAGTWLKQASDKLVAQQVTVTLKGARNKDLTLATADDWKNFLAKNAATQAQAKGFANRFGITFQDFCNVIDDAAAADDKGVALDLRPTSELAKSLSLDKVDGDYAAKLAKDAKLSLTGANGATAEAVAAGVPAIGPDILATPIADSWERDRTEQESWADFKLKDGANRTFRENAGVKAFEKLYKPKHDDAEAMALTERFTLPVHLEVSETAADGTVKFQDRDEMFREVYFDDKAGSLEKAGASVRARVRFDDKEPYPVRRVLIQAKEGRAVSGDNSAVHKFEKRFEGNYTDENKAQDMLRTGREEGGSPLKVSQVLYKLAKDKGTLPADETLRLEPKHVVLQKRRRSHMQIDGLSEVRNKLTEVTKQIDTLKGANQPVPASLERYGATLDKQVKFLEGADAVLRKYNQYLPSGEGFIISADRYSVYDPASRKGPPNDIDDETGRVGRGLHVEAEWDTAASEPFENAVDEVKKRLAATPAPANKAELEADLAALEGMRATIRKDVETTVALLKERLVSAGLEVDPAKKSKDERAAGFMKDGKRSVQWF